MKTMPLLDFSLGMRGTPCPMPHVPLLTTMWTI